MLRPADEILVIDRCFTRLTPIDEVDAVLRAAWDDLAMKASEPNAFAESWFVLPAAAHLRGKRDVRLAQVWSHQNGLIGTVPLTIYSRYGRIPARHISNWSHYQSFMGTPLVRSGYETAFWRELIAMLDAERWAAGFLSLTCMAEDGPLHRALIQVGSGLKREIATVHHYERAILSSRDRVEDYCKANIRPKKSKELRRLANRLSELGEVTFARLTDAALLETWCQQFLALEAAGWKGARGAALGNTPQTKLFFCETLHGAFARGRLDFQRLDLDGRAIAMLINFRTPPGSWSFKIAYDEDLARFSPGVLIELENLGVVLGDPELDWMDSCAIENHPMINSLWAQRRAIVQLSVPLAGARRVATYWLCRATENASAGLRQLRLRTGVF